MRKTRLHKHIIAILVAAILLAVFALPSAAAGGSLRVNGEAFTGTFQQALEKAMPGGVVEITGTVFTRPVGTGNIRVENVTIQGSGTGAALALEPMYFADYSNKMDVLTLQSNVTVKDLTINAGLRVDFPLRVFGTNVLVENVICTGGIRGGVNVLGLYTGTTQTYRNVQANNSLQGGFYFDNDPDCAGLTLTNCSTEGNLRVGVLVRNSYAAVQGLDMSGITCKEGVWAIEDRFTGTIGGSSRAELQILAGPQGTDGKTIDMSRARYIPFIENSSYKHLRFGVPASQRMGAVVEETTDIYGFTTTILSSAAPQKLFGLVVDFLSYTAYCARKLFTIWIPAVYF